MRIALVPRTTEFYDLFAQAGETARAAAKLVEQRFREFPDTSVRQEAIKELEHEGDRIRREMMELLNTQYITPFDREDIYELSKALDDVVDYIEHASDLLGLYKVESSMEQALAQCRVLVSAADALARALDELRKKKRTREHLAVVKELEDEADRIMRDAIAALFEDENIDPRTVIRWKDIFEALEDAIDACETAADVMGNIFVKNA